MVSDAFRRGKTDIESSYVGGTLEEEFASLLSLSHRVRVAPGSLSREFDPRDPGHRGRPLNLFGGQPTLLSGSRASPLPTLARHLNLEADLLTKYPQLEWQTARELARSARSYRMALWEVDSDPNLAWLLLVSAVETAASEWARLKHSAYPDSAMLLAEMRPDFALRLTKAADSASSAVLAEVGTTLNHVLRAGWKFRNFLLTYGLSEPQPRPPGWAALIWGLPEIKDSIDMVYRYRSLALHASIPFPPPMCGPPFPIDLENDDKTRVWSEKPHGSTYATGGVWTESGLPLNLHAFHHMVWHALTSWWRDIPEKLPVPGPSTLKTERPAKK
jgi:hypothetical protein